jgi:hypothetical protein
LEGPNRNVDPKKGAGRRIKGANPKLLRSARLERDLLLPGSYEIILNVSVELPECPQNSTLVMSNPNLFAKRFNSESGGLSLTQMRPLPGCEEFTIFACDWPT